MLCLVEPSHQARVIVIVDRRTQAERMKKMLRRVVDGGASGWEVTDPHLVS